MDSEEIAPKHYCKHTRRLELDMTKIPPRQRYLGSLSAFAEANKGYYPMNPSSMPWEGIGRRG